MDKKVMILDDERGVLNLMETVLVDSGYHVTCLDNAKRALDVLDKEFFSVVFSDLQIPVMNGVDFCREFRKRNQITWLVAITGMRSLFEITECREAGFDDYLFKPLELPLVLSVIEEAIRRIERWKGR